MNAVFLDRDGVIIRKAPEGEYITGWSEVEFLPGSVDAIRTLHRYGFKVIVVTNQRGVATGKIKLSSLEDIHARMRTVIAENGAVISAIDYCPHNTSDDCDCRKPKPGMLLRAAKAHGLSLSKCWMVGDTATEIEAGNRAGCKTALIGAYPESNGSNALPDLCEQSLELAVNRILQLENAVRHSTV